MLNLKIVPGIVQSLTKGKRAKTICMPMRYLVKNPKDVIEEAKLTQNFWGKYHRRQPSFNENKRGLTIFYINELKNDFGEHFHIHLYRSGVNFTPEIAFDLMEAGLDEIRFHPTEENFHRIQYALDRGMRVGQKFLSFRLLNMKNIYGI